MQNLDAQNQLTAVSVIAAQQATSTVTGSAVDIRDFIGTLKVTLSAGQATAGTSPTLDVKIQHSHTTTTGDFVDYTGATYTQVTDASGAVFESVGIDARAARRYIRALCTIGGSNTPTFPLAVVAVGTKAVI